MNVILFQEETVGFLEKVTELSFFNLIFKSFFFYVDIMVFVPSLK